MCLCFDQITCFEKFINLSVRENYWVRKMDFLRGAWKLKVQKIKGTKVFKVQLVLFFSIELTIYENVLWKAWKNFSIYFN